MSDESSNGGAFKVEKMLFWQKILNQNFLDRLKQPAQR